MFESKIKKVVLVAALVVAASACAVPSESTSDAEEKIEKTSDEEKQEQQKTDEAATSGDESTDTSSKSEDSERDEDDSNELTAYTDNLKVIEAVIEETDSYATIRNSSISFEPGESTATVSEAVVRATANVHVFNVGNDGQNITIDISSVEDNAWFRVIDPSGKVYGDVSTEGLTEFEEKAIAGDYAIVVSSQRGDASYDVTLEIE